MRRASKKYLTSNKIRLCLFIRSYSFYRIAYCLRVKYKINDKLTGIELCGRFCNKNAIPEISKLTRALNLNYISLWKAVVLDLKLPTSKELLRRDRIKIYLAIENELILLAKAKTNMSDYKDPDYEEESALLSLAIERVAGNSLREIRDDIIFSKELEALQRKCIYWYYKTAYKYKLPTLRITPFLLRLIS